MHYTFVHLHYFLQLQVSSISYRHFPPLPNSPGEETPTPSSPILTPLTNMNGSADDLQESYSSKIRFQLPPINIGSFECAPGLICKGVRSIMKFNLAPDFRDRVKQYKCYSTVTYKVLLNRPQPEVEQLCTNRKAVSAGAHRLSPLRRIVVVSLIVYVLKKMKST